MEKRGPGRPKVVAENTEYFTIAVPTEHLHAIEDWAWRLRIARAELIRRLLVDGLRPYYEAALPPIEISAPAAPNPSKGSTYD